MCPATASCGDARETCSEPRERQCVQLLGQGTDDGDTAVILRLSEHTVHNIVRRAMHKYGVASRMQAFVRALKDGQIRLEDVC